MKARVAVLSDTHLPRGARRLPRACLRELEAADLIVHAGDFVAYSVLELLRRIGPVEAVHGNVDDAALRSELPSERVVEAGGRRIAVVHDAGPATGRGARLVERFSGCEAIVYGHSHLPEIASARGVWILNPGSPTDRRRAPRHRMLRLVVRDDRIEPELLPLDP